MLTDNLTGPCRGLLLSVEAIPLCLVCIDRAASVFIDPAGNILRYMTSLLGCPVTLAHHRAVPECALKADACGTRFCRLDHRLPWSSVQPGCDRSQTRSLTFGRRHNMSHSLPTAHASNSSTQPQPSGHDLLVVGPGVLGSYVGILWQQQHPSATVVGQTNSTANHDRYCRMKTASSTNIIAHNLIACRLQQMHIQSRTKDSASSRKFPYVLFSAPPSGSTDYPAEVISPFARQLHSM